MIGQAKLTSLNDAISDLGKLTEALPGNQLVDMGARLRASQRALKELSDSIDEKVKSVSSEDKPVSGVSFKAMLSVSVRTGMDVKSLRARLPQKTWAPFVTSTTVISLLYSPN